MNIKIEIPSYDWDDFKKEMIFHFPEHVAKIRGGFRSDRFYLNQKSVDSNLSPEEQTIVRKIFGIYDFD